MTIPWEIFFPAVTAVCGLIAWFIVSLWKRQTWLADQHTQMSKDLTNALSEASKEHNEKLILAIKELGEKISNNTRDLWKHLGEIERASVRQDHLTIQLDPIRKDITLLREDSASLRAESEKRHGERAAEAKEIIKMLNSSKGG